MYRFWLLAAMACVAATAQADDSAPDHDKVATCMPCHGVDGISPNDAWPNLAGQKRGYLIRQLEAYQDGSRVDPMMSPMVRGLSRQDIRDIATYYSRLGKDGQ